VPRMRTIPATIEYLKAEDPGTSITAFWVRKMVLSGQLPSHKAGSRYLINLDWLLSYLETPPVSAAPEPELRGQIRRVRP
jgi:hypothetical protein